jgi:hypothetical protein
MLYREIIAVCSEIHAKHINTVCGQNIEFMNIKLVVHIVTSEPGSVVGIATAYGLDCPGIESLWGARFSAPVQTGAEAHTVSCTMGTGSYLGVKCGRGMTLTAHPLLVPRSKKWCRAIPVLSLRAFYERVKPTYI